MIKLKDIMGESFQYIFTPVSTSFLRSSPRAGELGFVAEMSTWSGNGYPNPINGKRHTGTTIARGEGDEREWIARGDADGKKYAILVHND